jgi:two-component system, cell cycle sensor histidine kinase and response regulator CckA
MSVLDAKPRVTSDVTIELTRDVAGHLHCPAGRRGEDMSDDLRAIAPRDTEGRYRGLLEAAPDAMVVVNQAGDIVLLNLQAEKQFGYQRDELVGQPVTNIIPEGFAERLIADDLRSAADALAQQIGTGIELVARRKDGTDFPIEIMLSPLDSAEGILVTAAIRDISVRRAAENELLQAQKLESIGRLAGGIAHDFNNMLSIIHGNAELLDQDLTVTEWAELDLTHAVGSVKAITGAASRAAALTAQLLAFSRQQVVKPQIVDINASVYAIEPMLGQLIGRNIDLALKLDPGAGTIRADPGQIDQIVVNLVVNARDAMPDGGTVTIQTSNVVAGAGLGRAQFDAPHSPYVLLAVTDTGVGMDQATRQHVFEPFFTTKDVGRGTGLGLATTYGIVQQAGGHISVESELGRGSDFRLYFPRVEAAAEEPSRIQRPGTAVGVGRILVVEDEPDLRDVTTQLLQRAGYRVATAPRRRASPGLGHPHRAVRRGRDRCRHAERLRHRARRGDDGARSACRRCPTLRLHTRGSWPGAGDCRGRGLRAQADHVGPLARSRSRCHRRPRRRTRRRRLTVR